MITWDEYCKTKCEWCAKGWQKYGDSRHVLTLGSDTRYRPCTAPSRDQFEQELQEEATHIVAAMKEEIATVKSDCEIAERGFHAAEERIAELDRENEELRKDKVRLETERNCAVAALQMAPQAPPTNQYCPDWVDAYRVWWVRRLPGTGKLIDDAMQSAEERK